LLKAIATQPSSENYVYANSYDSLDTVKNLLLSKTCDVMTSVAASTVTSGWTTTQMQTSAGALPATSLMAPSYDALAVNMGN
jgi:hypothetical protein